jgi:dethiobiotin synthetase
VIVEGVGGVLSPLDEETLVLDFAAQLGFPILIVTRATLGTINHTLLTLREVERRQLPIAGIVMNVTQAADEEAAEETRREIERIAKRRIDAVVPYLSKTRDGPAPTRLAMMARAMTALEDQLDIKQLLGLEGRKRRKGSRRA